ncbi:ParB/RepB/Spo0J family partition protein [Streptomyces sp. NPDC058758]|uniref:ParB/RepB/Spo0J family partition protein n=1 Tax=Streptomyces sp. NPDC058758 TaxID=3346627 RepID=UPI0036CE450A
MSKAKNLGAGASFVQARPISARRAAIGAVTAAPTEGVPDPTELALHLISQNPDNPREELRDLEGLADSIREIGLVNSITVATLDSYLAERPDRSGDVDEGARYIVVDGHRRLEAARLAGATTIRVSVNNRLVATDEALLEAAFVANVHRDDMNPIEQAHALKKLVQFYGSQNKAAKRLGIAQSTISSKLSILDLDLELQADLIDGRRTVEHVRNLSKLPPEEQRAKADARAKAAEQKAAAKRDLSRRDNPPLEDRRHATDDVPAPRSPAEPSPANTPMESPVPALAAEPTPASGGATTTEVALSDGAALMDLAFDHLPPEQRSAFIQRYFKRSTGVEAVVADLRADLELPAVAALAEILQEVAARLLEEN